MRQLAVASPEACIGSSGLVQPHLGLARLARTRFPVLSKPRIQLLCESPVGKWRSRFSWYLSAVATGNSLSPRLKRSIASTRSSSVQPDRGLALLLGRAHCPALSKLVVFFYGAALCGDCAAHLSTTTCSGRMR